MSSPTQFEQLAGKIDQLITTVNEIKVDLEKRDSSLMQYTNAEVTKLRAEFNDHKVAVRGELSSATVRISIIAAIVMAVVGAIIANAFK